MDYADYAKLCCSVTSQGVVTHPRVSCMQCQHRGDHYSSVGRAAVAHIPRCDTAATTYTQISGFRDVVVVKTGQVPPTFYLYAPWCLAHYYGVFRPWHKRRRFPRLYSTVLWSTPSRLVGSSDFARASAGSLCLCP